MKKEIDLNVGLRIRRQRERLGYSREMLAEKADIAVSFLGTIELGTKSFSSSTLIKLCDALNVSADYILFGYEQNGDLSGITGIISRIDEEYLPFIEELLTAFVKGVSVAEKKE